MSMLADPKTYLSYSEGMFRVIYGGVPLSIDKRTADEALRAAPGVKIADRAWDGDVGRWLPLAELITAHEGHMNSIKEREIEEMKELLDKHTFNPLHAYALHREGMGPYELADRLRHSPGSVGSLEYTHNLVRGDAPSATNALLPGQKRPALHPRNTARRAPKAWAPDLDFDLRSEMETGYCIGRERDGHGYNLSYSGKLVSYDMSSVESAVRRVAQLQEEYKDYSNVFLIHERGDVDLIKLLKKKPYYRILHSWV